MNAVEGAPLSRLDAEIETLLQRLAALEARSVADDERAIHEIAVAAIRERLRELSRRCDDRTCRIRIIQAARRAAN